VSFTLVHAGKYTTEDRLKTDTLQKLNTTQEKQTTQNKTTLVHLPFTTLGQETRWAYSKTLPSPHRAKMDAGSGYELAIVPFPG